jgi:hypothetical protein
LTEPRELAGEPDGEDSSEVVVDQQPPSVIETPKEEEAKPVEIQKEKSEEMEEEEETMVELSLSVETQEDSKKEEVKEEAEKPPTPPSSPLPDEDLPPMLPTTPPPVLQVKTPPARPTSLPGAASSTARSSFLHSALLGRPQVPVKPAALMLANVSSNGRRHQNTPVVSKDFCIILFLSNLGKLKN